MPLLRIDDLVHLAHSMNPPYFLSLYVVRYGEDPQRVKFTVEFAKNKLQREFVIEMAPLDLMPHSIHMFLDMLELKMWDNTVFWHQDDVEHVIAAALFNFFSGEPKYHHLKSLGWDGLQFPEYSEEYPHKKYTIGYSGRGPNIYINMADNTELHGPGGVHTGHHDLPEEADPCFARVVEGTDVVDALYRLSLEEKKKSKENDGREPTWQENELTRIVKVEVI